MSKKNRAALERLAEMAGRLGAEKGFRSLGPLGERHGSWEISFCKRATTAGELNRFVWLAFTEMWRDWEVELWVGADDASAFVRRLVLQNKITDWWIDSETSREEVLDRLEHAMEIANGLERSDLLEAYLPSRGRAGRG